MPHSYLGPSDFEREDLVFASDLSEDELFEWGEYDATTAYTEPVLIALENGDPCPTCDDDSSAKRDQYMVIEPVFAEYDSPKEFTLHAVLFECTEGHLFVVEVEDPVCEERS